jgi:hypothetical protein
MTTLRALVLGFVSGVSLMFVYTVAALRAKGRQ